MKTILILSLLFIPNIVTAAYVDYGCVMLKLHPNATYTGDMVNLHDRESINRTYIGELSTQSDMDAAWVDCSKDNKKRKVTEVADRKILAIASEKQQRNYIARVSELVEIKADGGTLTTGEQTELDTLKALWTSIKSIRMSEVAIHVEIGVLITLEDVQGYNSSATNSNWP